MNATTLDEYLATYGSLLGNNAESALNPLHVPGRDPLPDFSRYKRKPFPSQAHLIAGLVAAIPREPGILLCSKMGTGKTFMAIVTADMDAKGKPYRAIVMCPGHLVHKWKAEILATIPDARVTMLDSCKMLPKLYAKRRIAPTCPEWFVIGRDKIKLGAEWRPASTRFKKLRKLRPGQRCPKCGLPQKDRDGNFLPPEYFAKAQRTCKNFVSKRKARGQRGGPNGMIETVAECGERLWQHKGKQAGGLDRFAPDKFIHKRLRNYFHYFVLDEAHEEKSATSEQGEAAGCMAAACRKTLALTGTLIGGLANHVRPLLFRLNPRTLLAEGLGWNNPGLFDKRYGRIERVTTETSGETTVTGKHGRGKSKGRNVAEYVRPGVSPLLFGRHLLGVTAYMELEQISDQLPKLREFTWPILPDADQAKEYLRIDTELREANRELIRNGDRSLLGALLQTLLCWIDYPFNWPMVGYWRRGEPTPRNPEGKFFVPVVQPITLHEKLRPKEKKLLELIKAEVASGRQVWVYVQNTDTHDVLSRIVDIVNDAGVRAIALRSSVKSTDREHWINNKGGRYQVVVSHPKLVETGLDLFDKKGGHNFPTLIFYETGYNLFTLRQAAARSWRIGQKLECRVHYLYYEGTIQEAAMQLMGKKLAAAQSLEGKFTEDGLVAMGGDDVSMQMALAKAIDDMLPGAAVQLWGSLAEQGDLSDPADIFRADALDYDEETWNALASLEKDMGDDEDDEDLDADDISALLKEMEAEIDDDE
jgi:hypothetical protein